MPITVQPTRADIQIARTISRRTRPGVERTADVLTWVADEHVLLAGAVAWGLYAQVHPAHRSAANHVLLTTVSVVILPHLLKSVFNQCRPDRLTVLGHLRGVPISGKRLDAFPSGHAIHVGALASAASELPPAGRNLVWSIGAGAVATRVLLLAHWASDVVAGLVIGAAVERLIRRVTGFGAHRQADR
jgi:undecaprenyl-diphosphatase